VPPLSRLREQSGLDPYESSTIDAIRRMMNQGSLPMSQVCAVTGEPTLDVVSVTVKAPTAFQQKWDWKRHFFYSLVLSSYLVFLPRLFARTIAVEGSATTIRVPLCVSARRQAMLRRAGQRRLKSLLRKVPIYAKLLDENPYAIVSIEPASPSTGN
jgi:hypothetical protein